MKMGGRRICLLRKVSCGDFDYFFYCLISSSLCCMCGTISACLYLLFLSCFSLSAPLVLEKSWLFFPGMLTALKLLTCHFLRGQQEIKKKRDVSCWILVFFVTFKYAIRLGRLPFPIII